MKRLGVIFLTTDPVWSIHTLKENGWLLIAGGCLAQVIHHFQIPIQDFENESSSMFHLYTNILFVMPI